MAQVLKLISRFGLKRHLGKAGRHVDLVVVGLILSLLLVIIIQLPPTVMDGALVFNITLSVVILLTTIYIKTPLDFSVFPSLLLITTFYRLALNVATTRLILSNTNAQSTAPAGDVIETFGTFVAGDSAVVGFVIFAIIVVIQFVVITKGATRISEVAARFTLDAMPGKQLSIDADLNAGLIDEETARRRREEVMQQADFFGAMDGASKFIRGDAIAGIIITLVNIIGGLVIGTVIQDMSFGEAAEVFTRLTIGDGLVSQIPALVISLAAGLIVTRNTARKDLGRDVLSQLFSSHKSLFITSGFLLILLPSGLPIPVLLTISAGCATIAYFIGKKKIREEKKPEPKKAGEKSRTETIKDRALSMDALEIEVGYGLVGLVDGKNKGSLPDRISSIREKIAVSMGFVVPAIRIRDNMQLRPNDYVIKLRGVQIARWEVDPSRYLAMAAADGAEPVRGKETTEPAFGLKAYWIDDAEVAKAEAMGYTVVDPTSVIATHLSELIQKYAGELLTREEVSSLIEHLKQKAPAVVTEVVPELLKLGQIQKVLQHLLQEKISIRDMETIMETLADWGTRTKDPEILSEYVRHSLGRAICERYVEKDGRLYAVTLDPNLEEFINNAIERTERGSYLALSPEVSRKVMEQLKEKLTILIKEGHAPVVLCAPQIRYQLRRLVSGQFPDVSVLSLSEILPDIEVEVLGNIAVTV